MCARYKQSLVCKLLWMLFVLCHLDASLCLVSVSHLYHHPPQCDRSGSVIGTGTLMIMMIAQCLQLPLSHCLTVSLSHCFPVSISLCLISLPSHAASFLVWNMFVCCAFCLLADIFSIILALFSRSVVIYSTSAVICDCVCWFCWLQSHSSALYD